MRHLHRTTGLLIGALLGAGFALAGAAPASAHAGLESSNPTANASLEAAPQRIVLTFTEQIAKPAYIAVTGPSGTVVSEMATVEGPVVSAPLTDEGPGRYKVAYRVVSADGHPISASYTFTVRAQAGTAADPSVSPAPSPAEESSAPASPTESPTESPTGSPTATPSQTVAPGQRIVEEDEGSSTAVVLGVAAGVAVLGGLGLAIRRRRNQT